MIKRPRRKKDLREGSRFRQKPAGRKNPELSFKSQLNTERKGGGGWGERLKTSRATAKKNHKPTEKGRCGSTTLSKA